MVGIKSIYIIENRKGNATEYRIRPQQNTSYPIKFLSLLMVYTNISNAARIPQADRYGPHT